MKRLLLIISVVTLVVLGLAIIGQALLVAQGVVYDSDGLPVDRAPLALVLTYVVFIGSIVGGLLCLVAGLLALVAAASRNQYGWFVALLLAGAFALVGLFGMAWVLLSANSVVALVAPLALVPLVTGLYSLRPDTEIVRGTSAA